MIYRDFQALGRKVSALCMGTGGFGSSLSEEASFEILDAFYAMGGNFLDTARIYGDLEHGRFGLAERVIGRWLRARGNRDKIVVATKGAHPPLEDMRKGRLDRESLTSDLNESLDALQIETIDVYYLHRDDASRPVADILDTLNGFIAAGKARCLGASNWSPARLMEANAYAAAHGLKGFAADQPQWSLARQEVCDDDTLYQMDPALYRFHRESGVICAPFSSQAKGFFIKLYEGGEAALSPKARARFYSMRNLRIYQEVLRIHGETGLSVGAISLAFLTGESAFATFPIVGVSRMAQVAALEEAGDARLSADQRRRLLELTGLKG